MPRLRVLIALTVLGSGITAPTAAQWHVRSGGNALHNGFLNVVGPTSPQLRWQRSMPGIFGQPVFVDGSVVVTTWLQGGSPAVGTIVAMRLQTGDTLWTRSLPIDFTSDWSVYVCGMRDGKVYATRAGNSNASYLYALDTTNGNIVWRSQDLIDPYVTEGPVFTTNGDLLVGNIRNVLRINGSNGTRVYQAARGGIISGAQEPLIFGDKYYIRGGVVGDRLAAYNLANGQFLYYAESVGGAQAGLFAGPDGTLYSPLATLYAYRDTSGGLARLWTSPLVPNSAFSTFAIGPDSTVYVYAMSGDSMVVNRLQPKTGAVLNTSRPIKGGGSIFSGHMVIDRNGTLFVSNSESYLYSFNADLSLRWIDIVPRSEGGPALASDGTLLISGNDGLRAYRGGQLAAPDAAGGGVPSEWSLAQNYPNPFNPSTAIRYTLPARASVTLTVHNTLGETVATLVEGEKEAGTYEARFDASGLSSGVYFYRLQASPTAGGQTPILQVRKMLFVK